MGTVTSQMMMMMMMSESVATVKYDDDLFECDKGEDCGLLVSVWFVVQYSLGV